MTRKVYKSAMGKEVDLGALLLQNEHVRAVGNMNVNARGDVLDGANRVIETKNRQTQRQYKRTTNVSSSVPVHSSNRSAKQSAKQVDPVDDAIEEIFSDLVVEESIDTIEPVVAPEPVVPVTGGGLAAAIARSRIVKQEKEKTLRERQQAQGLRKI